MLARSATISIAMDERNDRLLVTYAASKKTNVNSGVLAQIRSPGRTADEVAGCVAKAVQRFCTRRAPQKHTYKPKEPPRLVEAAARRVLQHVEMFSADGAANEQLAGRLLHPAVERAGTADKLPNLKMILRDKAHAARRLTQRTFKVDPLLDDLQRTMLFGVEDASWGSVAKMLRDSGPCADIFKREVERQPQREGLAGVVTHLGYAKQRFDKAAKPPGGCCVEFGRRDQLVRPHSPGFRHQRASSESGRNFLDDALPGDDTASRHAGGRERRGFGARALL